MSGTSLFLDIGSMRQPLRSVLGAAVTVAAVVCASCAPVRLPAGPGAAQEDAAAYFDVMDRYCAPQVGDRAVVTASVLVRGTSNGAPVRGRVWVGADHTYRSLRVESEAPSQFILTAERALLADGDVSDGDATLYLPAQQSIVQRESSRVLLATVLGLPLAAHEFVWAFTGCQNLAGNLEARTFGPSAMRVSIGNTLPIDLFLRRKNSLSSWTLFAMSRDSQGHGFRWRTEYNRDRQNVLRSIRIVSEEASGVTGRLFDLGLSLSRVRIFPLVGSETFSPVVPAAARSVTLEAIQRERPRPSLPMLTAVR